MNATESAQRYMIRVEGIAGLSVASRAEFEVASTEDRWMAVNLQLLPAEARALGAGVHPMMFTVDRIDTGSGTPATVREKSTFVVPR